MAITKYRTSSWRPEIEQVEVTRETEQSVFIACKSGSDRREAKRSSYTQFHDSWADAHVYLSQRAESNVASCRRMLEKANGELGNIKGMRPA